LGAAGVYSAAPDSLTRLRGRVKETGKRRKGKEGGNRKGEGRRERGRGK